MRRSITASDVANEISMMRSVFKGTYLVVEGVTDSRLYGKFIEDGEVRILIAHSKDNVRKTVNEMYARRRDERTVGIVDKDMDGLLGKKRAPPIFETDSNDIESGMIRSSALDDVLAEYADMKKLDRYVVAQGEVRDRVARSASAVGILMYISYRKGMNLSFRDLDFEKFINFGTLSIDIPKMVSEVYSNSMDQMYPKNVVSDMVRSRMRKGFDPWESVRGHDAVSILAIGLKRTFGSYNARHLTDGELGGALRLSYDWSDFRTTGLYGDSRSWSESHGIPLWETTRYGMSADPGTVLSRDRSVSKSAFSVPDEVAMIFWTLRSLSSNIFLQCSLRTTAFS